MTKPPHESTIELTPEMIKQGQREHEYVLWLAAYRSGAMTDERWQDLQADPDFVFWQMQL